MWIFENYSKLVFYCFNWQIPGVIIHAMGKHTGLLFNGRTEK
jgi:hypothetical protein